MGGVVSRFVAENRGRGDAAVVFAHVGQRGQAGAVTDRIQPSSRDAGHAHLPVHGHRLPRLKTCLLHADPGGGGPAAHRDQNLVAGELTPVRHRRHHRAVSAHPAGCGQARSCHHGGAFGLERCAQLLASERFLAGEQPLRALEHHHVLAAQPLERLRHLGTNGAASEDEQPPGDLLGAGGRPVVPRARLAQAGNRRDHRDAAGGQHDRPGSPQPAGGAVGALDVDRPFPRQPPGTAHQFDSRGLQPALLPVVAPVRGHVVALGERSGTVQRARDRFRRTRHAPRRGQDIARPDERLAGDAAPVGAFTTGQFPLDDGHPQAAVGQAPGGVLTSRPGADHQHVVCVGHGWPPSPCSC